MAQNLVACDKLCIRAFKDGPCAPRLRQHVYDVVGSAWKMPGGYFVGARSPSARATPARCAPLRSIPSPLSKRPASLTFARARYTDS